MRLSFFPSFFDKPTHIHFADQEEDENIELFLRQHWITNVLWISASVLGFILPLIVIKLARDYNLNQSLMVPENILISVVILWLLLVTAYALQHFLHWYFNIYIVTNKHLVDMDLPNIMHRHTTEVQLNDVESARTVMKGFAKAFFNYGDLIIETAAERQSIDFHRIPKPDFVKERIQDLQETQEALGHAH